MIVKNSNIAANNNWTCKNNIVFDENQIKILRVLTALDNELELYSEQMGKTGWKARLSFSKLKRTTPKGIYIWGGVGCGKTMLMDLFFQNSKISEKKKVHFHSFMQEVHRRIHSFREAQNFGKVSKDSDPIQALSRVISDQAWLLCFDEFHVTDIGDAMILGRLFESLFSRGVIIVTTSNRHPNQLYEDGIQRERFLPFIDLILKTLNIQKLASGIDYRLKQEMQDGVYLTPCNDETDKILEEMFYRLAGSNKWRALTIKVSGHELKISRTHGRIGFSEFASLCEKPLGAGDYLEIAKAFDTLLLGRIPCMGAENKDAALRFVTLIDALYEYKVNLVCSAEVTPEKLYVEGQGAFEFKRTVSRLLEMQSNEYIKISDKKNQ